MPKFLNTTGVSYHLEELMRNTKERLILISPYLQLSERVKEHLTNLIAQKQDIRIVYRENKLQLEENNWIVAKTGVRTSICKNLHAKCYLNEKQAIITSMNLYEFSQVNNNEMGILINREDDAELYSDTMLEASRLLQISQEVQLTVKTISPGDSVKAKLSDSKSTKVIQLAKDKSGFCIRTGEAIPFNIEKPMTYESYKSWAKFSVEDFAEKYCHFSGEPSNGETSMARPILKKNWKQAQQVFSL